MQYVEVDPANVGQVNYEQFLEISMLFILILIFICFVYIYIYYK